MRNLSAVPPEKRLRIAKETLEIYSPIANRLGMNVMRTELQDLGFSELYPMRYRVLDESVKKARGNRKEIISKKGWRSGQLDKSEDKDPLVASYRQIFSQPAVTSLIIGTINPQHLKQNIAALAMVSVH